MRRTTLRDEVTIEARSSFEFSRDATATAKTHKNQRGQIRKEILNTLSGKGAETADEGLREADGASDSHHALRIGFDEVEEIRKGRGKTFEGIQSGFRHCDVS